MSESCVYDSLSDSAGQGGIFRDVGCLVVFFLRLKEGRDRISCLEFIVVL